MLQSVITVIPSLIAMSASLKGVISSLTSTKITSIAADVKGAVATAGHTAAVVAHKIATWGLNAALATKVGLLTLGAGLVVAATATTLFLADATSKAAKAEADMAEEIKEVNAPTAELSATLTDLAMSKEEVITASEETITALTNINTALDELQAAVGGMPTFWGGKFGELSGIVSSWAEDAISQINAVKEAFEETSEEVIGGSIWDEMWKDITAETKKGLNKNIKEIDGAMRDIRRILSSPFHMEIVLTVDAKNIRAQVEKIIAEVLKSVVIEKTTARAVTSRIRLPTTPTPKISRV